MLLFTDDVRETFPRYNKFSPVYRPIELDNNRLSVRSYKKFSFYFLENHEIGIFQFRLDVFDPNKSNLIDENREENEEKKIIEILSIREKKTSLPWSATVTMMKRNT